jgi:hypothetical protein
MDQPGAFYDGLTWRSGNINFKILRQLSFHLKGHRTQLAGFFDIF